MRQNKENWTDLHKVWQSLIYSSRRRNSKQCCSHLTFDPCHHIHLHCNQTPVWPKVWWSQTCDLLISSTSLLAMVSSILFSSNQPYLPFSRNPPWKPTHQLSSYRPISNLSLISKIIECVVKSRLTDYLSSNNLLNPHQSAYCKHHSTETALDYIHDHLINAIGSQKYTVSAYSTYLRPSTPLTTTFSSLISILVWDSRLCLKLVQVIPVFPLFSC